MKKAKVTQFMPPDVIWIETAAGQRYPVQCYGRDPEAVAALAARDLKQPVKVVKQDV